MSGSRSATAANIVLQRRIRVQGNFTEYVPMALILFMFVELQGWPRWLVHGLCLLLLAARLVHAYGISQEPEDIRFRATGMATTALLLLAAAALLLYDRGPMTVDLARTPSFRLDGKRALVTGGGRGIGLAAASALAAAGAHVTLAARTKAEIEEAAAAIRARGDKADALVLDVTDLEAMQAAIGKRAAVQHPGQQRRHQPSEDADGRQDRGLRRRDGRSTCAPPISWRRRWRAG